MIDDMIDLILKGIITEDDLRVGSKKKKLFDEALDELEAEEEEEEHGCN